MNNKIRKRIGSLVLAGVLLVGLLAGCAGGRGETAQEKDGLTASGGKETGNGVSGAGAYLEEDVAFPEAVQKGELGLDNILLSPEGELVLYASYQDADVEQKIVRYTLQQDDSWAEETEPWMTAVEWNGSRMATGFSYDAEGNFYIVALTHTGEGEEEAWGNEFYRVKARETDLERLELKTIGEEGLIRCLLAQNGKVIQQPTASPANACVTDLESGNVLYEFYRERGCPIWYGDQILVLEGGDSRLLFLNGETGETEETVTILDREEDGGYFSDGSSLYAEKGKGIWLAGMEGLLHLAEGGSKWEVLLEAGQSVMGMPSYYIDNLLKVGENTFYLQYTNSTSYENGLVRIRYQEGIQAERNQVLSIYSLEESESIRQAVVEFQREHLDVRVEYRAVMEENSSATREDCIQALNTELLAGKGADLIVLDSLSAETYVKNGILADLSDLMDSLAAEGLLLPNVAEAVRQDTISEMAASGREVFYIPTHMSVPIWMGSERALQSVGSIEELAAASAQAELPYLGRECYDYQALFGLLYDRYGADLIQDGDIRQEKLESFFESYLTLAKQSATEGEEVFLEQSSIGSTYGKNGELGAFDIGMKLLLMEPEKVMRETGYGYVVLRDGFEPLINLAINQASEQKELAAQFIRKMLSVSIQEVDLDGLPVNPQVVEEMPQKRQESVMTGIDYFELLPDGSKELKQLIAECPTEEEMQEFASRVKQLKQVIRKEEQVKKLLEAELPALFRGEKALEAVTESLYQKIKTYLAE